MTLDTIFKRAGGKHGFRDKNAIDHESIVKLIQSIRNANLDFIKVENLYLFDGKPGFTASQGE